MEVFLQWVIMLLGILGVVQLGELFSIWAHRPAKKVPCFAVMPLSGEIQNVGLLLDYFQEVAMWSPESPLALVIDCGLTDQCAADCKLWCSSNKRVSFCTQKEFLEICKAAQDTVY